MMILTCSTTKPTKLQVESTNQVVPSIVIFAVSSHRVLTQVEKIYK
jgi:hypothetical protein